MHGKVDTTNLCVCTCTVCPTQCSRCVVCDPSAMAAIQRMCDTHYLHAHDKQI